MLNMMIFGISKQLFVENVLVPGETETRNVAAEFVETKQVTAVQPVCFLVCQCNLLEFQG